MFLRYVFLRWTIMCLWSASFGTSFFRASNVFHLASKFNVHHRVPRHSSTDSAIQGDLESQSAHLKLLETKTINDHNEKTASKDDDDDNDDNDDNDHLLVREYVFVNDTSKVLLAAVGGSDNLQLELYSKHVFGTNYSQIEGVLLRETKLDTQNTSLFNMYVDLWKAERLIANSKDFPNDTKKGQQKVGKFVGPLAGHVRRMKQLRLERPTTDTILEGFLHRHQIMTRFQHDPQRNRQEILSSLKQLAEWFRSEFPYYYQSCLHCGHRDDNMCYGLVFPSIDERAHEAGRTELYICSQTNCSQTSRFPRYNAVCKVLETRRGRCGEYSVLLMRMLNMLGYEARWTVDWADHVWCEVKVEDQWVHMDPCEASVNEPLIYEGWGKNQTYILSYSDTDVEDVTAKYTTKFNETLLRRQDDDVNTTFIEERLIGIRKQLHEKEEVG